MNPGSIRQQAWPGPGAGVGAGACEGAGAGAGAGEPVSGVHSEFPSAILVAHIRLQGGPLEQGSHVPSGFRSRSNSRSRSRSM